MNEPTNQRDKRHAVLYFSPKNSAAYKELAARVRSDGGRTTLVWSNQWKGAESILSECRAVIIEEGCANADDIVESYRRYASNCEIHFADADGEFPEDVDGDGQPNPPANDTFIEPDDTTDQNGDGSVDEEDEAIEEEHTDQDAETDSVVEETASDAGDDAGDSDGDGEDAGTADEGGEAGAEEPSDPTESSSN